MNNYVVYGIVSSISETPSDMGDRYILSGVSSNSILSAYNNFIVFAIGSPNKPEWNYKSPHHGDTAVVITDGGGVRVTSFYEYSAVNGWVHQFNYQLV